MLRDVPASVDTPLYRTLSAGTELAWLATLWLVASLPVVTAPAATVALFRMVRLRADAVTGSTTRRFVQTFATDLGYRTRVGGAWLLAGVVLVGDFWAFAALPDPARTAATALLISMVIAFAATTPYLLTVLAGPRIGGRAALRLAVVAVLRSPGVAVRCLIIEAACLTSVLVVWPLVFLVPALGAAALDRLCRQAVEDAARLEAAGVTA